MNKWKILFWIVLVVSCINYVYFFPPIIADISPDNYYEELSLYDTKAVDPTSVDYNRDSDGDGLTDYDETNKYKTLADNADSDGDGISDSDWKERKEYTRTYTAIVDLREPYSLEDMNDFYQDARLVEVIDSETSRFEIVLYPEASEVLSPFVFKPVESVYTAPTFSKNYDDEMKDTIRQFVKDSETELQALIELQREFHKISYYKIDSDFGFSTDLPLQFQYYKDPDGNIVKNFIGYPTTYSLEKLLDSFYFAKGMFNNNTHGACSSSATLRGAMFRAAGLEEQTVFTIPLFYKASDDNTHIDAKNIPSDKYIAKEGEWEWPSVADHFFNVVKIGSRWIRVDSGNIDTGIYAPYVKLLNCHDQADYQWDDWNYNTFWKTRPYKYVSIVEEFPYINRKLQTLFS